MYKQERCLLLRYSEQGSLAEMSILLLMFMCVCIYMCICVYVYV